MSGDDSVAENHMITRRPQTAPSGDVSVSHEIIDSIYDGIMENPPWKNFLALFRQHMDGVAAGLWLRPPNLEQVKLSLSDIEPGRERLMEQFQEQYHESAVLFRSDVIHGRVKLFSDIISDEELKKSAHYHDFLAPNDLADGLQYFIEEPGGLRLWVEVGRSSDRPPFGDRERQACSALTPHFERALSIYSRMMKSRSEAEVYSQLAEQLTVGVITLDRNARIVEASALARALIDELDCIDIAQGELVLTDETSQAAFAAAFQKALKLYEQGSQLSTAELVRIEPSTGKPFGLLVKCLQSNLWYEGAGCPVVVLYLNDTMTHRTAREYFVAKLFGLTISEAGVAILLAEGKTLSEAATILNVTENTARTVSKRIFAKTGVRRQAELVRIILNSVALLS